VCVCVCLKEGKKKRGRRFDAFFFQPPPLFLPSQACDHIHANEIVLTLGHCATTLLFLKEAAKKRPFQVVVAEAAPSYDGHSMAAALAAAGVATTLVADAAVFAVMARVHKVVLGARCVLASGGVMAAAGGANVAAAAQRHAVPVVALVGTHQLSPLFPHDPALAFNDFGSPADVLPYEAVAEASVAATAAAEAGAPPPSPRAVEAAAAAAVAAAAARPLLHAHSPRLDYIPPAHVALFVTDTGGYTPAYVYRLLAEYYSRDDYSLTR
jgi:translation initiation factor eIF-2B subunit beta